MMKSFIQILFLATTNWNLTLSQQRPCKTVSGPKPNSTCVFPFVFEGHTYESCKHDDENTRWCSTKVDSNGKHQKGHWGNCDNDCPKGCHVQNQKGKFVECAFPFSMPSFAGRGNQLFNECIKQYPDDEASPSICYTKKNSTTNEAIIGQGDWGICEKKYCPDVQDSDLLDRNFGVTKNSIEIKHAMYEGLSRHRFNIQTPNNCTCKSTCRCSPDDGCMVDWCPVEDSCGEYQESRGNWDWCLYKDRAKPTYVELDWKTKHDLLWSQVEQNDKYGDGYDFRKFTRSQSLVASFRNDWDVIMPADRHKTIHSVGATCPFTMEISKDSPFTGIFKPGANVTGIMRMSPSTDFTNLKNPGLRPSIGIKFLRTGARSANFVAMKDLNALPNNSHNFFGVTLSNQLPPEIMSPITLRLVRRFCTTRQCINKVGLSNICTFDQDGKEYPDPIFPFRVFLEPNKDLYNLFPHEPMDSIRSFLDNFKNIPVGTKVYTIKAQRDPEDEGFILGDIINTDECVSSYFGDKTLFFRHQWFVEDIALRPQWAKEYYDGCHCHYPEIDETDPIKANEEMEKFIKHQHLITQQFDDPSSNSEPLDCPFKKRSPK